jgi:hypothetical protein
MALSTSLLFSLVVCNAALKMDSSLAVTELGTVQLMEMKNNLKHKLDLNEMASPGEKKVFEYFKQLIINTSLPRLTSSAVKDNQTILRTWNNILNCSNVLASHRDVHWSALHNTFTETRERHDECRSTQFNPNTTCNNCEAMVGTWTPPGGSLPGDRVPVYHTTATVEANNYVSYGDERSYGALSSWFAEYHSWHCGIHNCPAPTSGTGTRMECHEECLEACVTSITEHTNRVENCSQWQDDFESATCDWKDDITSACTQFADCKTDHDGVYNTTIAQTHESSRRREVEYQIMMTIVCFIDLLTADTRPTADDKVACQKHYDMDMFVLYYPHTQYQDEDATVYVPGSSDCTCLTYPAPAGGCPVGDVHVHHYSGATPCANFEETYYAPEQWYNAAPPDACNPCSS